MDMKNSALTALLALVFGFLGAAAWSYAGLADNRTRSYLIENPTVLQDVAVALQDEQARARLADAGDGVFEPFPGTVLGNPEGSKVLVEFTDYNCGYCAAAHPHIQRLIAEDPDLKVVMREWPIFEGSEMAARMALAAGLQGKYAGFHDALFNIGDTSQAGLELAASQAGLDLERAKADAMSEAVSAELVRNVERAREIGFSGTPGFIAGDRPIAGYVEYEVLKDALEDAAG